MVFDFEYQVAEGLEVPTLIGPTRQKKLDGDGMPPRCRGGAHDGPTAGHGGLWGAGGSQARKCPGGRPLPPGAPGSSGPRLARKCKSILLNTGAAAFGRRHPLEVVTTSTSMTKY